jgi:hypothetical protein
MPGGKTLGQLIAYLVRRLGSVPRTKLVKLVYLVDERWSQQHPTTLTGTSYVRDNHGPNAEGNVIVKAADVMQGHEVRMQTSLSKWGKPQYIYKVGHAARFQPEFAQEAMDVIEEILQLYGGLSIDDIVAVSKSTTPFRQSPPLGGKLDMRPLSDRARDSLGQLQESVRALGDLKRFADLPVGDEEPARGVVDKIQRKALLAETE